MKKFVKVLKNAFLGIMGGGVICLVFFYLCSTLTAQLRLKLYGKKTNAVVRKVWLYKAYPHVLYEFEVDGIKYQGEKGQFPVDIAVNDSIRITFLSNNPEINMALND